MNIPTSYCIAGFCIGAGVLAKAITVMSFVSITLGSLVGATALYLNIRKIRKGDK